MESRFGTATGSFGGKLITVITFASLVTLGDAAWAPPATYLARLGGDASNEVNETIPDQVPKITSINENVSILSTSETHSSAGPFVLDSYKFGTAFGSALSMIAATELGDKTFIIAAILAMRNSRTSVYVGAVGALALMTILSVGIGWALPQLVPKLYSWYVSIALFIYFGLRMLIESVYMYIWPSETNEELEEVEKELGVSDEEQVGDAEALIKKPAKVVAPIPSAVLPLIPAVVAQAFTLTFMAEWGDRSQLATVIMSANKGISGATGITLGAIIGHACCTGLAVLGGRYIATRISERTVAFFGGLLFLAFAALDIYKGPE